MARDHFACCSRLCCLTRPGLVAVGVVAFSTHGTRPVRADDDHAGRYQAGLGWTGLNDHHARYPHRAAARGQAIFAILPVVFYAVMQRYIVAGITAGAVKG